ncbi:helix-turn-helix domain-containing protein [Massilia niastensis]|uniref:helix-turn-helix domain-containing protein n=1 Tax=Massilia niastensis TaxID=544911 RepID=UPI00035D37CB|nr:helix-turn-helix domain-containing protein [Massilia niastensis]
MNHTSGQDEQREPWLQSAPARCSRCAVRNLCLPIGTSVDDADRLEGILGCVRRVARDEVLFRRGQPFCTLYAVRCGHLKTSRPDHRGHPYVAAFHMAGDLMGMDAICTGRHACTAVALEDSEVCEISYARLQMALQDMPGLMQYFHCAMSREIVREQGALMHANGQAAERLACFLLSLSARYAQRGFSSRRFRLRMSRADMGDHLGLTIECVSRQLARFRDEGWISIDKRDVELIDIRRLEALTMAPEA